MSLWRLWISLIALGLSTISMQVTADSDAAEKFVSDYERGQSVNGQVNNNARPPLWEDEVMVEEAPSTTQVAGSIPTELGQTDIGATNIVTATGLKTVIERLKEVDEFRELLERVQNDGALGDTNYGHTGHLDDLQLRASDLEELFNAAGEAGLTP